MAHTETNLLLQLDDTVVPMEQIPSLEVTVWSTDLTLEPGNTEAVLPNWSAPKCHPSVTAGRPGGCKTDTDEGNPATSA